MALANVELPLLVKVFSRSMPVMLTTIIAIAVDGTHALEHKYAMVERANVVITSKLAA